MPACRRGSPPSLGPVDECRRQIPVKLVCRPVMVSSVVSAAFSLSLSFCGMRFTRIWSSSMWVTGQQDGTLPQVRSEFFEHGCLLVR
jgi:hypothetical protein